MRSFCPLQILWQNCCDTCCISRLPVGHMTLTDILLDKPTSLLQTERGRNVVCDSRRLDIFHEGYIWHFTYYRPSYLQKFKNVSGTVPFTLHSSLLVLSADEAILLPQLPVTKTQDLVSNTSTSLQAWRVVVRCFHGTKHITVNRLFVGMSKLYAWRKPESYVSLWCLVPSFFLAVLSAASSGRGDGGVSTGAAKARAR